MRSAVLHGSRVLHSRDDRTTRRSLTVETLYIGPDRGHIFVVPRPAAPVFRTLVARHTSPDASCTTMKHRMSSLIVLRPGSVAGSSAGRGDRVRARMSCSVGGARRQNNKQTGELLCCGAWADASAQGPGKSAQHDSAKLGRRGGAARTSYAARCAGSASLQAAADCLGARSAAPFVSISRFLVRYRT